MTTIVVGVDESEHSLRAVDWAVEETLRRGAALRVIHAVAPWLFDGPGDPPTEALRKWELTRGEEVLERALEYVRATAPGIHVEGVVVPGPAPRALLEQAAKAAMLVVASHGVDGVAGMLLGSVATQVTMHATTPVTVVRGLEPAVYGEVVVGVDGSRNGDPAVGLAFEAASARGARLHAVHAWTHPAATGDGGLQPLVYDKNVVAEDEGRLLAEAIAGWRARFPDVEVVSDVVQGHTVRVLAGASARADLLVVGARGGGGFGHLLMGSVTNHLLHQSHCPLVVVPPSTPDSSG